jgi:hypothetical protein
MLSNLKHIVERISSLTNHEAGPVRDEMVRRMLKQSLCDALGCLEEIEEAIDSTKGDGN